MEVFMWNLNDKELVMTRYRELEGKPVYNARMA